MPLLLRIIFVSIVGFTHLQNTSAIQTIEVHGHDNEMLADTWAERAHATISEHVLNTWDKTAAKSGVLLVGGGMSLHTLRASRAYLGQAIRKETPLFFENFPIVGMAKTFCVDSQVGDEACTATAYLRGVKGRAGVVGTPGTGAALRCGIPDDVGERFGSIVEWAQEAGKSVGIVTTSSVTQPSVASAYGRSSWSSWESDADMNNDVDPEDCHDLAHQLIYKNPGNKFKVILGGGRGNFLPNTTNSQGRRKDSKNLITEWTNDKVNKQVISHYVSNREELMELRNTTEYLLGLFSSGPMEFHMQANSSQPTLEEMTEAAIKILSKNDKGFFLFIFGGRINDAHNQNKARLAVDETLELNKAARKVSEMTNPAETLMIVTADHAHTMTISGYASRWNDIFGEVKPSSDDKDTDGFPYLSLNYANGPGFRARNEEGLRVHVEKEEQFLKRDPNFQFPAVFPLTSGSYGAEDVAVFARGPSQHLFTGVFEQHLIPHLMAYSLCVGPGITVCKNNVSEIVVSHSNYSDLSSSSSSTLVVPSSNLYFTIPLLSLSVNVIL